MKNIITGTFSNFALSGVKYTVSPHTYGDEEKVKLSAAPNGVLDYKIAIQPLAGENDKYVLRFWLNGYAKKEGTPFWSGKDVVTLPFAGFMANVDGDDYIDVSTAPLYSERVYSETELLSLKLATKTVFQNHGGYVLHTRAMNLQSAEVVEFIASCLQFYGL